MYKDQQNAAIKAAENGLNRLALRHNIAALKMVNPVGGRAVVRDATINNLRDQLGDTPANILPELRARLKRECGLNVAQLEDVFRVVTQVIDSV